MPFVYILKCADNSYYTGMTVDLEHRLAQHHAGTYEGYTNSRLPVQLVAPFDCGGQIGSRLVIANRAACAQGAFLGSLETEIGGDVDS